MTGSDGLDRARRSSNRSGFDALKPVPQFTGGVNDTELDLVDGRAVGLLEHYGPAGAGYWLWRALSSSEQELLSDVELEQLGEDLAVTASSPDGSA